MFEKWGENEDSSCFSEEDGKWRILGIYILKGVAFVAKHILKTKKYVFKPTFWLEILMKLICNKLGNEEHMF
jgi:hypothetical protein